MPVKCSCMHIGLLLLLLSSACAVDPISVRGAESRANWDRLVAAARGTWTDFEQANGRGTSDIDTSTDRMVVDVYLPSDDVVRIRYQDEQVGNASKDVFCFIDIERLDGVRVAVRRLDRTSKGAFEVLGDIVVTGDEVSVIAWCNEKKLRLRWSEKATEFCEEWGTGEADPSTWRRSRKRN